MTAPVAVYIDQFYRTFPSRWHFVGSVVVGALAVNLFSTVYFFNDMVNSVVHEFDEADDVSGMDGNEDNSYEFQSSSGEKKGRKKRRKEDARH